jgi:hypothetical protein
MKSIYGGIEMTEKKVDDGWKESAEKSKESLSDENKAGSSKSQLPEANFLSFISGIATQALMQLGDIENPFTHKKEFSEEEAKYTIDLLAVMQKKTKGNLTDEEGRYLQAALTDLRMRFVEKKK